MNMVPSPCTGVCTLDPTRQHCLGCLRTLAEIARWGSATDDEKRQILQRIGASRGVPNPAAPTARRQ